MFDKFNRSFVCDTLRNISGPRTPLLKTIVKDTLREVRMALLAWRTVRLLPVVPRLHQLSTAKESAVGQLKSIKKPGQGQGVRSNRAQPSWVAAVWAKNETAHDSAAQPSAVVPDGRPAGRVQNHDQRHGKPGEIPAMHKQQRCTVVSADVYRPGGDQTAGNPGRAGRRRFLSV